MQWIRTRWASMHMFLERMLILQKVSILLIYLINSVLILLYRV
jgi:hypothetical protein